jgi:hypothetical protein
MIGPETFDQYVHSADLIGDLKASSVWAIGYFYFIFREWRRDRNEDKLIEVKLRSAEASVKNAEAVEQVSEKIVQLIIVNSEISSVIKEVREEHRELNRRIKCLGG